MKRIYMKITDEINCSLRITLFKIIHVSSLCRIECIEALPKSENHPNPIDGALIQRETNVAVGFVGSKYSRAHISKDTRQWNEFLPDV